MLKIGFVSFKNGGGCTTAAINASRYFAGGGYSVTLVEPQKVLTPVFINLNEVDRFKDGITIFPGWAGEELDCEIAVFDLGITPSLSKAIPCDKYYLCADITEDDEEMLVEYMQENGYEYTLLLKECSKERLSAFKKIKNSSTYSIPKILTRCSQDFAELLDIALRAAGMIPPSVNMESEAWDDLHVKEDEKDPQTSALNSFIGIATSVVSSTVNIVKDTSERLKSKKDKPEPEPEPEEEPVSAEPDMSDAITPEDDQNEDALKNSSTGILSSIFCTGKGFISRFGERYGKAKANLKDRFNKEDAEEKEISEESAKLQDEKEKRKKKEKVAKVEYFGHVSLFVTSLRHGSGSSYTAGSIAAAFAKKGNTVCLCHQPETNIPQDKKITEYTNGNSFEQAFRKGRIVIYDRGPFGGITKDDMSEMYRSDIKILVCGEEEPDIERLASFIHKLGEDLAKDWLYVFNLPRSKRRKFYIEELMQEYHIMFLPMHDYNAIPSAIADKWLKEFKKHQSMSL